MDPKIPNPGYLFSIRRFGIKESLSLGIPTKLCTGRFTAKPPPSEQKAQKAIADNNNNNNNNNNNKHYTEPVGFIVESRR